MASTHEEVFNFLVIKEMQIKATVRFHLIPVRMVIIKSNNNNKCWQGCGKTGTLIHYYYTLLVGMQISTNKHYEKQ
jgi:hypothetical protein